MLRIVAGGAVVTVQPAVRFHLHGVRRTIHTAGRSKEIRTGMTPSSARAGRAGRPGRALAAAGDDEELDAVIGEETEAALSRTGKDVGTPIITLSPGTPGETSFFGLVLAKCPLVARRRCRIWDVFDAARPYSGVRRGQALGERSSDFCVGGVPLAPVGDPPLGHPEQPGHEHHRPEHQKNLVPTALVGEDGGAGRGNADGARPMLPILRCHGTDLIGALA